jgi:hypothetical protein
MLHLVLHLAGRRVEPWRSWPPHRILSVHLRQPKWLASLLLDSGKASLQSAAHWLMDFCQCIEDSLCLVVLSHCRPSGDRREDPVRHPEMSSAAHLLSVGMAVIQHWRGWASSCARWYPNSRRSWTSPVPPTCHSLGSRISWSSWNLQWLSSTTIAPVGSRAVDLQALHGYL